MALPVILPSLPHRVGGLRLLLKLRQIAQQPKGVALKVQKEIEAIEKTASVDAQSLPTGTHDFVYYITPRVWQLTNNVQKKMFDLEVHQNQSGVSQTNYYSRGPRPVVVPLIF